MEEKPKITGWSYDENMRSNNPELQQQKPISWGEVADNTAADTKEHVVLRRFNYLFIFIAFIVAWVISNILGVILFLATLIPIIIMTIQAPKKPSKTFEVIFWIFIALIGSYILL